MNNSTGTHLRKKKDRQNYHKINTDPNINSLKSNENENENHNTQYNNDQNQNDRTNTHHKSNPGNSKKSGFYRNPNESHFF